MMETHNTHLAPGFSLKDLVPAPANVLPAVEPLFPVWPENLPDPTLLLEIRLSHQSTARYRAAEFQTL